MTDLAPEEIKAPGGDPGSAAAPRSGSAQDHQMETLPERVRSDPPGLVMDGAGAVAKLRVIHPKEVEGVWTRRRRWLNYGLLLPLLFFLPWIKVAGQQAVLIDLPGRRMILFGHLFFPQDSFLLFLILAGAGFTLFFFTSLFGRIWCGFACPQTVFIEGIFRPMERLLDGPARQRIKAEGQPRSVGGWLRFGLKHLIYLLLAQAIALTSVAWFYGTGPLVDEVLGFQTHQPAFWIATALTGVFWFDFAIFREQFCMFVCPYARIQGVLMDANTSVVGYDQKRGEPRGKLRGPQATTGDCIDCRQCVAVCPTGIDIRDGIQLECISCARCIDACDAVMSRVHQPKGLLRFDSENALLRGQERVRIWGRPVVYGALLLLIGISFFLALAKRDPINLVLLHDKQLAIVMSDGRIANPVTVKIQNKDSAPRDILLELLSGADELVVPGRTVTLGSGEQASVSVLILRDPSSAADAEPVLLRAGDGELSVEGSIRFFSLPGAAQ